MTLPSLKACKPDPWLVRILIVNACICYVIGLMLFVSKWFPYGSAMVRIREWLYAFF